MVEQSTTSDYNLALDDRYSVESSVDDLHLHEVAARHGDAAIAGHVGDEEGARHYLSDEEPSVRTTAFAALVRMERANPSDVAAALSDSDATVRRAACEHGASLAGANFVPLLDDEDHSVVEAAAYAVGAQRDRRATNPLCRIVKSHDVARCRESVVVALGAIGDVQAKSTILSALEDTPAIRRRAVIALSRFDGDDVATALQARRTDRDWQVRQAAEDVLGISGEEQNSPPT